MEKTPITSDFPLRPIGEGETLVQVFRTAAQQSAAADEQGITPGPRAPPPCTSLRRSSRPSLQRRLYEADGRPVRLGRYDVIRCVGSGGMGVVYEAVSVDHGHRVALKTLRWMTSLGLSRFKNEFRSLCGVAHPNLVALYELGAAEGEWFFTMELVEGQSFLEHVQAGSGRLLGGWEYLGETLDESVPAARLTAPDSRDEEARLDESGVVVRRTFHEGRLRAALRQLASAVARLHELGKLHRDLNPGNVLVTREGRVVVLDFGLISDRARRPGAAYDGASGTPAYMSPEQAAGKPATPASDWYGFGVMLFEALTGQLPFTGSSLRMLTNKRHQDAPPPSALMAGLPPDLDELCAGLLRRAPQDRPDAATVLLTLGVLPRRTRLPAPGGETFFAGRQAELAALDEALGAAAGRRSVAVAVRGPAGIGKSRLVAHFLDQVTAGGEPAASTRRPLGSAAPSGPAPVVLRGACLERETIPHRLLDAAVDSLAAHLATLPAAEVRALLPPGARELALVFPVLEGLDAINLGDARERHAGQGEDEQAAFVCLRELLARLAATRPVVLAIDDAHFGDHVEARRLAEIVAPPPPAEAPPESHGLLVVVVDASEDPASSPVLIELAGSIGELRRIDVGPLTLEEANTLVVRALPADLSDAGVTAEIAAASGGSPLAVEELAHHYADAGGDVSLDEAIGARLAGLSEPARRLAEVVAAVGAPIDRELLFAAAGARPWGDTALAVLTANRVVRAGGVGARDRVRIHDERLRAVLLARTPPTVARRIHLDLALAQAARPGVDPVETAASFQRAGERAFAAGHLALAAARAAAGGEQERAADLWDRARWLTPLGSAEARAFSVHRAGALAAAGRSAAAAAAYLDSTAGAPAAEALDLRRRAAEHLLVAGHVDEGLAALRPVLEAHGIRWPGSSRSARWKLGARVVELRLRGTGLSDRPTAPGPPGPEAPAHARIEALWSAGRALSTIDPLRSSVFVIEALLAALAAGDADHATVALAFVGSIFVYHGGAAEEARGLALIEEAARFARRSGDPYLLGFSWFCSGLARLGAGRFREALARVEEGLGLLASRGEHRSWERTAYRTVCLQALFELGALADRARRAEAWLRDARARDDRAGAVQAGLAVAFGALACGNPGRARDLVREAMELSWRGFGVPHQIALWIEVSSLLYEGAAAAARARLLAAWPELRASQLLRIQLVRIGALHLRGLTAVAAGGPDLRLAEVDAAHLARERRPHALAAAALLRAGIARQKGEIARAVSGLEAAACGYASAEMMVHAAAARRARGVLLGGHEGRTLVAEADALLAAEGVREGARWAAMYTALSG